MKLMSMEEIVRERYERTVDRVKNWEVFDEYECEMPEGAGTFVAYDQFDNPLHCGDVVFADMGFAEIWRVRIMDDKLHTDGFLGDCVAIPCEPGFVALKNVILDEEHSPKYEC